MERRGLVRTPSLSAAATNSSFPQSCSQPCSPVGLQLSDPNTLWDFPAAPIPTPLSSVVLPKVGQALSSALDPPAPPSLPHPGLPMCFCSSSGIIQRTASFLHRGTNSCSAPALALLCLSLGSPAQLRGGLEACHPCQKLSHPLWLPVVAGGGTGLGSWCSSTCRGRAPAPAEGLQGWGCQISAVQGMSELPGGLEVSHGTFTVELLGAWGRWLGLGCSSGEGTSLKDPLGVV